MQTFNEDKHNNSLGYRYFLDIKNYSYPSHYHANFEIIFVVSGQIKITIDDFTSVIKMGESVLILPNQVHSFTTNDSSHIYIGVFATHYIPNLYEDFLAKKPVNPIMNFEHNFFEDIKKNIDNKYLLTSLLCKLFNNFLENREFLERKSQTATFMHKTIEYFNDNISNNINIVDFSNHFGYNSHYMSKKFREIFLCSFSDYLNKYRLDKALHLIQNSTQKMSDIASQCGFNSIRNFNRQFFNAFGKTPTQYRI